MIGYVYLLHFSAPVSTRHTCQHYVGYTDDLPRRIQAHQHGNAARLTQVAHDRGLTFQVVRVWQGSRELERRLKDRKNAPRLCPVCNPHPQPVKTAREFSQAEINDLLIPF